MEYNSPWIVHPIYLGFIKHWIFDGGKCVGDAKIGKRLDISNQK
jgi:hypothetical protein